MTTMINRHERILIIDDETNLTNLLSLMRESKGFRTFKAYSAAEGLEKVEQVNPDLIILDITMPEINGIDFYNVLRKREKERKHPVLIVSAREDLKNTFNGIDIEGFISKGEHTDILFRKINEIFSRKKIENKKENIEFIKKEYNNVLIVDRNEEFSKQLQRDLSDIGFTADHAQSESDTIKKVMISQPDIVLVNLNQYDLSGDVLVTNLYHHYNLDKIHYFVYFDPESDDNPSFTDKINSKSGIARVIESKKSKEIAENLLEIMYSKIYLSSTF